MKKLFIIIILLLAVAVLYLFFRTQLFAMVMANPATAYIYTQIVGRTLLGLFYISVLGTLFFIFFPAEVPFIYYVLLGYNPLLVMLICVAGNLIGIAFDYGVGRLLGQGLLQRWMKGKYQTWSRWVDKWGAALVLFGNIVPFPIEPASLVIGGLGYPFGRFMKWSALGRILKYALTWLILIYASHTLLPLIAAYLPLNATII